MDLTTSTTALPPAGDAPLIVLPELGSCVFEMKGFAHETLDVGVEWTVQDRQGRILWIGASEGKSEGPMGHGKGMDRNFKKLELTAIADAAARFAEELAIAPELQKPGRPAAGTHAPNSPLRETAEAQTAATGSDSPRANPNVYTLEYVHSDKEWEIEGYGLNKAAKGTLVAYDALSPGLLSQAIVEMSRRGFARTTQPDGVNIRLKIGIEDVELSKCSYKWGAPPCWPSVKITATIEVADAGNRTILKKDYTGESGLTGKGFLIIKESVGKVLEDANAQLFRNAALDDEFNQALRNALATAFASER